MVSSLVAPQTEVGGGFGWMNRKLLPPSVFADSSRNEKENIIQAKLLGFACVKHSFSRTCSSEMDKLLLLNLAWKCSGDSLLFVIRIFGIYIIVLWLKI